MHRSPVPDVLRKYGSTVLLIMAVMRAGAQSDTTALRQLVQQAQRLTKDARYDSALTILARLRTQAERTSLPGWLAQAQLQSGEVYGRVGDHAMAVNYLRQALAGFTALGDTAMEAQAEFELAFGYKLAMRSKDAVPHNERALALYGALHDTVGMALTLNNMAAVHSDMGVRADAGQDLQRAYALLKPGHHPELRKIITAMAQLADREGDLPRSIAYADTAVAMQEAAGDGNGAARALSYRSRAKLELDRKEDALADARAARRLTADPLYALDAVVAEAKALQALGRTQDALAAFGDAEHMALSIGNMGMVGMAQLRQADLLEARGDMKAAYAKLKYYTHLQDSCRMVGSVRDVTRAEMNLAFAKKQLADSLANVEARHLEARDQALVLARERHRSQLLLVGGAAVLLLALLLWSRLRYARRAHAAILEAQERLVESEKQREAEQVRTRIARDVHDEIGSELTKITLLIAQKRMTRTGGLVPADLDDVATLSQHVSGSLNDVVWAVDPRHDTVGSLLMHAQHFTERLLADAAVEARLKFLSDADERPIDPSHKRDLFLLLKEALNNALKHAGSTSLWVSLVVEGPRFDLEVRDDGSGFDRAALARAGNGLRNMQARADALGAALEVITAPGKGCTVRATGTLA